jgi:hypothetical protein
VNDEHIVELLHGLTSRLTDLRPTLTVERHFIFILIFSVIFLLASIAKYMIN